MCLPDRSSQAEWDDGVQDIVSRLAERFGRNMADGKRTFYAQAAAPALAEKYAIATETMVDMFQSPDQRRKIDDFLSGATKRRRLAAQQQADSQAEQQAGQQPSAEVRSGEPAVQT